MTIIQLFNILCIASIVYLMSRKVLWSIMASVSYVSILFVCGFRCVALSESIGRFVDLCAVYLFLFSCVRRFRSTLMWVLSALLFGSGVFWGVGYIAGIIAVIVTIWYSHYIDIKKYFTGITVLSAFVALLLRYALFDTLIPPVVCRISWDSTMLILPLIPYIFLTVLYIYIYNKRYRGKTGPMLIYIYCVIMSVMAVIDLLFFSFRGTFGMLATLVMIAGASAANEITDWISSEHQKYRFFITICIMIFVILGQEIGSFLYNHYI